MTEITRTDNLDALTDIIQTINSSLQLDEVLRIVMDTIIRLTHSERGFLMLRDAKGDFNTVVARNWEQESLSDRETALSHTVIQRVFSTEQPVLTTNAQEDPRFGSQDSVIIHNLRSILCVPLKVKDQLTGVIYTDNRVRAGIFTETEKDILVTFANHAAIALENASLLESVRLALAEVNELEGLMENVFASIASGVITTNNNGVITLCNQAAAQILRTPRNHITGMALGDVFSPHIDAAQTNQLLNEIRRIQQSGFSVVGREITLGFSDQNPVIISLNLSPLRDANQNTQGVAIVMDDLTEKKRLQAQYRLFERMVSPAVINLLDPDKLQLGGKQAQISILFADIRDFTPFSEKTSPEELVKILNQYLAIAANSILSEQGTIDKFLGDAVMAWFNAPIPQPDHTLRAVRAALAIRSAIKKLKRLIPEKYHLSFGAGIHFGDAVLGLVGTEQRLEYTAIGDSINTAKRIQENAAANQILISETAYQLVSEDIQVKPIGKILAKGKSNPICVYEVLGLKSKDNH